ncbi:unnamed protein product [Clonostachys rosea f. rosea IK726]|uniref:Uncharacterized protein n=2 Tax=Bionectria ochroleuca TaxID=29856 RepID=A0A0B7JNG6_BIOOC|nr:unnamed protein product [Clonostachys rosea f. rosea IK726]
MSHDSPPTETIEDGSNIALTSLEPTPAKTESTGSASQEGRFLRYKLFQTDKDESINPEKKQMITLAQQDFVSQPQENKLHLYFLPNIKKDEDHDGPGLVEDQKICEKLTNALHLEPFFLTEEAWDSNGFFVHKRIIAGSDNAVKGHSYAARFLIKFLEPEKDENETVEEQKAPYKWLFLSFSVLWLKKAGKVTCVVACYDDCGKLQDKIEEALARYPLRYLESNPFAIYDAFLRLYIWQYDEGIWKFRKPVRKIEKQREKFMNTVVSLRSTKGANTTIVQEYHKMHELSRHAIHMSETVQVATLSVKLALEIIESQLQLLSLTNDNEKNDARNVIDGIRFSASFIAALKLRSDAFVDRIENEIKMAYNIVSVYQLSETRDESKELTQFVTSLSLVFLPLTFVVGFWGMNFVQLNNERKLYVSPDAWWFAWTGFLAVLLAWLLYQWTKSFRGIKRTMKAIKGVNFNVTFPQRQQEKVLRGIGSHASTGPDVV